MINPGELTHQITLQIKTITQDAELNSIETWNDWRTVWASLLPKTGREYYRLSTRNSEITEVFKIWYIGNINVHQRIKFQNKYFEIIEVINTDEKNIELLLSCKAVI